MCHSQWKLSHKGSELKFDQNTTEGDNSFSLLKFVKKKTVGLDVKDFEQDEWYAK